MYVPDNLDLFDAYEREEARRERYYRDPFEPQGLFDPYEDGEKEEEDEF